MFCGVEAKTWVTRPKCCWHNYCKLGVHLSRMIVRNCDSCIKVTWILQIWLQQFFVACLCAIFKKRFRPNASRWWRWRHWLCCWSLCQYADVLICQKSHCLFSRQLFWVLNITCVTSPARLWVWRSPKLQLPTEAWKLKQLTTVIAVTFDCSLTMVGPTPTQPSIPLGTVSEDHAALARKAKAGRVHSIRGCSWITRGCAGKNMKSIDNACHAWALLQWGFFTKRRYLKCMTSFTLSWKLAVIQTLRLQLL